MQMNENFLHHADNFMRESQAKVYYKANANMYLEFYQNITDNIFKS